MSSAVYIPEMLIFLRGVFERDVVGMASVAEVLQAIDTADEFECEFGYLPPDIHEWREETLKSMKRDIENC